jgi:hypothetical protein
MSAAMISFTCPQCAKRFSAPAAASGKQVTCSGCGSKVVVPSPGTPPAASPPHPSFAGGSFAAPTSSPVASSAPNSFSFGSSSVGGGTSYSSTTTNRRDFPALKFVASVVVVLSWVYVVGGLLGGVAAIGAAGAQRMPGSLLIGIAVALLALLGAVFIRAGAEMIRLALYLVELLEDIRAK